MSETENDGPKPACFDRRMLEALVCPVTHGALIWDSEKQELISKSAKLAFPVRGGVPVMLVSEARELG
ncbi:Trm112 family protein [Pseudogemmobacter bohemicus]|uniref:Trm112 family protein n=1 Tax=Pseudogemmobacter bohemicus TaxID=2250708 RepID=UPI000DD43AA9|nr:Trm112 family protein [Pseudogemmobacter bohemicus]